MHTLGTEDPALVKQAPLKKKNKIIIIKKNPSSPLAHSFFISTPEGHCPFAPSTLLQLNEVRESHFNRFPKHVSDDKAPAAVKAQVHNTQPSD